MESGTAQTKYEDLKRWHEHVQKTGFTNCNVCIMASDVATEFIKDKEIQAMLDVKNYELAVIKPTQKENNTTYLEPYMNWAWTFTSTMNGIWMTSQTLQSRRINQWFQMEHL